ncbi:hypothetical protein AV530_011421 [Patagioenas fasciata monilis]|uniref:Uncharacterized protein n=1 Tax=Patagioenas fasciata monilis TaxID=372326 RepID=A0A1V4KR49_PATFA|nr:hypothetical protein AV530_011421 [Patagioenas fasciata monilis]
MRVGALPQPPCQQLGGAGRESPGRESPGGCASPAEGTEGLPRFASQRDRDTTSSPAARRNVLNPVVLPEEMKNIQPSPAQASLNPLKNPKSHRTSVIHRLLADKLSGKEMKTTDGATHRNSHKCSTTVPELQVSPNIDTSRGE